MGKNPTRATCVAFALVLSFSPALAFTEPAVSMDDYLGLARLPETVQLRVEVTTPPRHDGFFEVTCRASACLDQVTARFGIYASEGVQVLEQPHQLDATLSKSRATTFRIRGRLRPGSSDNVLAIDVQYPYPTDAAEAYVKADPDGTYRNLAIRLRTLELIEEMAGQSTRLVTLGESVQF